MENRTVFMPERLTAENGAKALLSGEFYEEIYVPCTECGESDAGCCETCGDEMLVLCKVPVTWTTIKAIYAAAIKEFAT